MKKFSLSNLIKYIYVKSSGYAYTNLGRLFLRIFVGIMLMSFGVRQANEVDILRHIFPSVLGMGSEGTLIVMICIEIICSVFIMFGFLTRLMTIPPLVAMILAEHNLLSNHFGPYDMINYLQPGYLPMMFLGFFFFILLVGPGKISVDYFVSLYILHSDNHSEGELEEV